MHLSQESRERIRKFISGKIEEQVRDLLEYPAGSVGRIMTSDFLAFNKDVTALEAIGKIRALSKKRFPMSYAYVVDDENRLTGVLNMRDLMAETLRAKGQPVTIFMGEGMRGPVAELYIASLRRDMKWILPEVKAKDPQAFYVLEAARDVSWVLKPTFAPLGGWRALSKRK